jgi:hypothetical protein
MVHGEEVLHVSSEREQIDVDGVNVVSPESRVRQVKLDVVPSELVESVEINKTLIANMDGDASGVWPIQREYYQPRYAAGLRWDPHFAR